MARTVDSDRKHLTEVLRAGRRPPGHGARGDLPELQHLQRRRLRGPQGQAAGRGGRHPAGARRSRSASARDGAKGVVRDPADRRPEGRRRHRRRTSRRSWSTTRTPPSPTTAFALSRLADPDTLHHTPIGVLRAVERPVYDTQMADQLDTAIEQHGKGDLARAARRQRHLDRRRLSRRRHGARRPGRVVRTGGPRACTPGRRRLRRASSYASRAACTASMPLARSSAPAPAPARRPRGRGR